MRDEINTFNTPSVKDLKPDCTKDISKALNLIINIDLKKDGGVHWSGFHIIKK